MTGVASVGSGGNECLGESERLELLRLARTAIEAALSGERLPRCQGTGMLADPRGVFVTLRRADGTLRGCIGVIEAQAPLVEAVAEMAVAAARADPRFHAVTPRELPELVIEISALSPPAPVDPGDVVCGRDGLILRFRGQRGVLLPQVPAEHGWDRETFLEALCRKAGLRSGAYAEPGAELLAFRAEVFSEKPL